MAGWVLREYRVVDQGGVDALLDADSERLFVTQGHRLHGLARDGERWRRTLVAEVNGSIVGAATVARNKWHPAYTTLIVEVAAAYRRRGLGTELAGAARSLRRGGKFFTKIKQRDRAAIAFAESLNGRVLVTQPLPVLDPTDPPTASWLDSQMPPEGVTLAPLATVPSRERSRLWAAQYPWVHESWNPLDSDHADELDRLAAAKFNSDMSAVARTSTGVVAAAFASPFADCVMVVVETIQRDPPQGQAAVAAVLAQSIRYIFAAGRTDARVDGHTFDPHLAPVVATLPADTPLDVLFGFVLPGV